MKHVQLDTFVEIMENGDDELIESLIKISDEGYDFYNNKGMDAYERQSFYKLCKKVIPHLSPGQKEGFVLGFRINQGIREEFDVLRYSSDAILNIELKSELPKGGLTDVKNQLIRHQYLLNVLEKKVNLFTYLESEDQLYSLDDHNNLIKVEITHLLNSIGDEYRIDKTLERLNVNEMVISPYTQSEKFTKREYFLTDEQIRKRYKIIESDKQLICLSGGPGTGKSLLLVDIAKQYKELDKRVAIVFGSKMSWGEASEISSNLGIDITPVREVTSDNSILDGYDIILVDEAHRIREHVFEMLISQQVEKMVFAVDHKQVLHPTEKRVNIEKRLKTMPEVDYFKLKYRIRTDRAMSSFIRKFLHLKSRKVQPYDYDKVQIVYFEDKDRAVEYMNYKCNEENYVSIELTEYRTKMSGREVRNHACDYSLGTHDVIGREYDNVLVLFDEYFEYCKEDAMLISTYPGYYPYLEDKQVFQALTRVKNQLLLVILNNPELYKIAQKIKTWKLDRLAKNN